MLAIRMQRTGRTGLPNYRIIVQDSRRSPTSGKVVARLGFYNPHTKELNLDKEKSQKYLDNGAQPSERVTQLLKQEGIKLPSWVAERTTKLRPTRKADKLRKNQSTQEGDASEVTEPLAEESAPVDTPAEEKNEVTTAETV